MGWRETIKCYLLALHVLFESTGQLNVSTTPFDIVEAGGAEGSFMALVAILNP